MSEREVLVVDDNSENLILIDLLLRSGGFNVRTADSARNALEALSAEVPDALLTDIQMPDVDGLELIRRVRLNPLTSKIVILAVSANAMKENIQEAYDAGCNGYITKPLDTRTFADSVRARFEAAPVSETQAMEQEELHAPDPVSPLSTELCADCSRQIEPLMGPMNDALRRQQAGDVLHSCAGIAGVLSYPHITAVALDLERNSPSLGEQDFIAGLRRLQELLEEVRVDLGSPAV